MKDSGTSGAGGRRRAPAAVLALLLLLLLASAGCNPGSGAKPAAGELRMFYVVEELPPDSFVCNLVTELDLESKYDRAILDRLRFSFFTQPTFDRTYFRLDERRSRRAGQTNPRPLTPTSDVELDQTCETKT